MRRFIPFGAMLLAASIAAVPAGAQRGSPPHAWLFGTWTGGLFPAAPHVSARTCQAQPAVIFGQDAVAHASLTLPGMIQRVIETAKAAGNRVDFRFVPVSDAPPGLLGQPDLAATGFGCESPDVLHVERKGPNEITFPGCRDFPNPLVRCPG